MENYNLSLTKDANPYPGLPAVLTGQSFSDIDRSHGSQKWNPFDPLVNKVLNFKQDDIHFWLFISSYSDGKISLQEMISAVRRLKNAPSEAKCQKIAEMLDQDHDGTLDLDDVEMVSAENHVM